MTSDLQLSDSDKLLPDGIFGMYGCDTCTARHSKDCPHYDFNKQHTLLPEELICDNYKRYLLALTPVYDTKPTLSRWQRDVSIKLMMKTSWSEFNQLQELERKLHQCKSEEDSPERNKQIKILNNLYNQCFHRWEKITKTVTDFEDKQVGRETVKKTELTIKSKPSPMEYVDWINRGSEEVIDAEIEDATEE